MFYKRVVEAGFRPVRHIGKALRPRPGLYSLYEDNDDRHRRIAHVAGAGEGVVSVGATGPAPEKYKKFNDHGDTTRFR